MCEIGLLLSTAGAGLNMLQQQQRADAAERAQAAAAATRRAQVIAEYDETQRDFLSEKAKASRALTDKALAALAAREKLRVASSARGLAQSSRSSDQAVNAVTAAEGRDADAIAAELSGLAHDASARLDAAHRGAQLAALRNRDAGRPDHLGGALGFLSQHWSDLGGAGAPTSSVDAQIRRHIGGLG